MVLDITVDAGMLEAQISGGMGGQGGPREVTSITKSGTSLVLSYSMMRGGGGGQGMPATLTLTPDGAEMKAEMSFGGQFTRTGTATKSQ
jgi:hypothetical protein